MVRRILAFCLSVMLLFSAVPAQAFAAESVTEPAIEETAPETTMPVEETAPEAETEPQATEETIPQDAEEVIDETAAGASGTYGSLSWKLVRGTLTISGTGDMKDGTIPWASNKSTIKTIIIEEGVTSIAAKAFSGCFQLRSVSIPGTVTKLGSGAFANCMALTSVTLPEGVTHIGQAAFFECSRLNTLYLPATLTYIDDQAFDECVQLTDVYYNGRASQWDAVTVRGSNTYLTDANFHFTYTVLEGTCGDQLTWVLEDSLLTISGTGKMKDFTNDSIPWKAERDAIRKVVIEPGVTTIGKSAFSVCTNLSEIQLPEGLTAIGTAAFLECIKLTTISLPASITKIADFAFCDTGIKEVYYAGSRTTWRAISIGEENDRLLNSIIHFMDENNTISGNCGKNVTWTLSENTLTVSGTGSMTDFTSDTVPWSSYLEEIHRVVIESGIKNVGAYAFANCTNLTQVELPDTLTAIGTSAFSICTALTEIRIPEGTKTIGMASFIECIGLKELTLPSTLAKVEEFAFAGCPVSDIYYTGGPEDWNRITILEGNTPLEDATFHYLIAPEKIIISNEKNKVVSGTTVWCSLGDSAVPVTFFATVLPEGAPQDFCWQMAEESAAYAACRINADNSVTLIPTGVPGTVTLTAATTDGSGLSASVSVKFTAFRIDKEEIEGEDPADYALFSGKSRNLQILDSTTGKALTARQITWSLAEEFEPFASITPAGRLTTKKVFETVRITVLGTITGNEDIRIPVLVDIYPALTYLQVLDAEGTNVTGKTVLMDYTEEALTLTADVLPETMAKYTWTVSDSKNTYAKEYKIDGKTLTIAGPTGKAGTVTLKATAEAGVKKTTTVKVTFGSYAKVVAIAEPEKTTIRSGETLVLSASITEPETVTKPGIVWTVSDTKLASVSSGKLKAKAVSHPETVTVTATSKDGCASDSVKITILPKNEGQLVLVSGTKYLTNTTTALNTGDTLKVTAAVVANGEPVAETVTWTSAKQSVATVAADGTITAVAPGSAKITAAAEDGRKVVVTVKVATLVKDMTLGTKDGKNLAEENGETLVILASGKSVNLAANILTAGAAKTVTWEITDGRDYAKLASSGKFTANKDLTKPVYVTVKATAKDGSGYAASIRVKILPIATGVQIYESGTRVRSNTTYICDMMTTPALKLSARVFPVNAAQAYSLASSNKKVADFVNGELICYKPGTVTITATAQDGSNTKAIFKLTVVKGIQSLTLEDQTVIGGQSLNLAKLVQINPTDATNKKLKWEILDNGCGATITAAGLLKTKAVTEETTVTVIVSPSDAFGATPAVCTVAITPRK